MIPLSQPDPSRKQWELTTVKDERVWRDHEGRFAIQWAGRMKQPYSCYRLWDSQEKHAILGFQNEGQAQEAAYYLEHPHFQHRIGLIACCGEKLDHPARADQLYQSDLFKKALAYCRRHYRRNVILSAKHGVVKLNQVIEPYDQKLTASYNRLWAVNVELELSKLRFCNTMFYAHAGQLYTERLVTHLPMIFPLKGLGIGEQLAWYKKH